MNRRALLPLLAAAALAIAASAAEAGPVLRSAGGVWGIDDDGSPLDRVGDPGPTGEGEVDRALLGLLQEARPAHPSRAGGGVTVRLFDVVDTTSLRFLQAAVPPPALPPPPVAGDLAGLDGLDLSEPLLECPHTEAEGIGGPTLLRVSSACASTIVPNPEPASLALFAIGLAVIGWSWRARRVRADRGAAGPQTR